MSIANVSIVGNLVKAPQQVQFESGKIKTTMVIAVNTPGREKRGGDKADFYMVETWGKLAELVAGRLDKGNQVTAQGRLLMSKWKDDKGLERVTPTISAIDIAFPQRSKNSEYSSGAATFPTTALPTAAVPDVSLVPSQSSPPTVSIVREDEVSDTDEEYVAEEVPEEEVSDYGQPNSSTKAAPMRRERGAPR